ncbi:MAG: Gfo/Idh/MocA family oxidoreductase [Albidovulum sp.]|nr:Gfo/Idh/MocA family oxidoreductase [Albidovulum sp.]MDE0308067.1 Gfo/Idh/MocA family oxidoreductase [Albidovulum sp.]MDE0533853.1 Gfo/Idh/MocA family oxidoreductase [Albidovulum sp.]
MTDSPVQTLGPIGIGMLGAGFIGQMHSLSFACSKFARCEPRVDAKLVALADISEDLAVEIGGRYDWEEVHADWNNVVNHPDVSIFVNSGPNNMHRMPSIAAARNGKHVFSEKPLAATASEAFEIWKAAENAGIVHMCAFLHRFIPALRLARQIIQEGRLGQIRHFRSNFLLNMQHIDSVLTWRYDRKIAGAGATGDLGSHHIDLARYLVGEVARVNSMTKSWSRDSSGRVSDVNEDWFASAAEFENGGTASFEASRLPEGHMLTGCIQVDGTRGTLSFDMQRLNELNFAEPGKGPRRIWAATGNDPFGDFWLPVGIQGAHPAGWRDCFAYQAHHMLHAVATGRALDDDAATFEDGYRVAEIVEAILESAASGKARDVRFRS